MKCWFPFLSYLTSFMNGTLSLDSRVDFTADKIKSKSHKHNLSKADTCLKRTKILVPKAFALDRVHCNNSLFFSARYSCIFFTIKTSEQEEFNDLIITLKSWILVLTLCSMFNPGKLKV